MRRVFLSIFLLTGSVPAAVAQSSNAVMSIPSSNAITPGSMDASTFGLNQYLTTMKPNGLSGVSGSPYVDNRWLPARMAFTNNLPLEPVQLKYDALAGRILMRPANGIGDSLQLNDVMLAQFELNEPATAKSPARKRTFRRFLEAATPSQQREYVEVLHQGQFTLLKRYTKVIRAGSRTGLGETNDQILSHEEYYMVLPNTAPVSVKLSVKSLSAADPAIAGPLKADASAQKAKTDADWVAVLATVDPVK
jgi:hypothetical protein